MKKSKRTWLWSIQHEDFAGTSYLFGMVHLNAEKVFGFLDAALKKLDQCEAVATEFNFEEAKEQSSAQSLDLPDDYSLKAYLGEKKMQKLQKVFERETGLPLASFENMHPFVITSMLTQAIMPSEMNASLDETIWQVAMEMRKSPHGLETYASQMALIEKLPLKKQVKQLKSMISNFRKLKPQQKKLLDLYASADLSRLNKMALKQAKGFRKAMIYNRNVNMVNSFMAIAKNESLFAAVGAGHLPGEKGMLRLFKQAGCVVKPVKSSTV